MSSAQKGVGSVPLIPDPWLRLDTVLHKQQAIQTQETRAVGEGFH